MKTATRALQTSVAILVAGALLSGCSSAPAATPYVTEPVVDISVVSKALSAASPESSTVEVSASGPSRGSELTAIITVPSDAVVDAGTAKAVVEAVCAAAPGEYSLFTPTFAREGAGSTILDPDGAIDTEALLDEAYGRYAETGIVSASGSVIMKEACD